MTKEPIVGVDIHNPDGGLFGKCLRCMVDTALYGEAYWNTDTMEHLNPNAIDFDHKECTFTRKPDILTISDLLEVIPA